MTMTISLADLLLASSAPAQSVPTSPDHPWHGSAELNMKENTGTIVPFVEHYVEQFSRRTGKHIDHIPDEVADAFMSYSWRGNIRELQSVIERVVILSDDGVLANPLRPIHDAQVIGLPANTTLKDSERGLIETALEAAGWVIGGPSGAAAKLGMKRTTLM